MMYFTEKEQLELNNSIKLLKLKPTMNPLSCSVEYLILASQDANFVTRAVVAVNPRTPIDIIIKLSKDEHYYVRMYAAKNRNLPPEILTHLSDDKHWLVKVHVAQNINTPIDTLIKLSKSYIDKVRDSATETRIRKLNLLK